MITIVDYGLGNIFAFVNVYNRLNIKINVAHDSKDLKNVTKIILPGVGAFDYAMSQLNNSGMREELEHQVINNKIPILGICVGMQMLANSSDEGIMAGLGWIDGTVRLLNTSMIPYRTKLPHMGWNTINPELDNPILKGLDRTSKFYFLHSYYFDSKNELDIISTTEYGNTFTSAVNNSNVFGVQFHPEKSHSHGIKLLKNFAEL